MFMFFISLSRSYFDLPLARILPFLVVVSVTLILSLISLPISWILFVVLAYDTSGLDSMTQMFWLLSCVILQLLFTK